jgi:hypothetical protein
LLHSKGTGLGFKRNKFKAVRTNGFGSKMEAAGYEWLKARELAGEINSIKCQQAVTLLEKNGHSIRWKIDFSFVVKESNQLEYLEVKGVETADYRIKLKLYKMNPPAPLTILKGTYRKLFIAERVELII